LIVIAHRGACGLRPEHSRSAYELAIEQGCDFVEADVVVSADGELIVRHDNELSGSTDVASREDFAHRRTRKTIDGRAVEGWFAEDFTLRELKALRCREPWPELRPESAAHDGSEQLLTLQEVVDIAAAEGLRRLREVGLFIELKHPGWFATRGLPLEPRVADLLKENGLDRRDAPAFVECFEPSALKRMRRLTQAPLAQLIGFAGAPADAAGRADIPSYADMTTPKGLAAIAGYAVAICPEKQLVLARDDAGASAGVTALIERAREARLQVHAWTFRAENRFLPLDLRSGEDPAAHGDLAEELRRAEAAGLDGAFTDFPGLAAKAE
jgi:glycerophosphoryl diester phosphodiesterase